MKMKQIIPIVVLGLFIISIPIYKYKTNLKDISTSNNENSIKSNSDLHKNEFKLSSINNSRTPKFIADFSRKLQTIASIKKLNREIHLNEVVKTNEKSNTASSTSCDTSPLPRSGDKMFNLSNYITNLQYIDYYLKPGETLSDIARKYESYCNPNTTIKLISLKSKLTTPNDLEIGTHLLIPKTAIMNGTLYKVCSGDTWCTVVQKYYPGYSTDSIMKFIITINNLPNNDLPLGENVFLPNISNL